MSSICENSSKPLALPGQGDSYPRFRWLVLLAMFLATAASDVIMIYPAPLMGVIAKSLGMTLGDTTAYLMGLFNLVVAISCIVGGIACDRAGLMPVLVFSSLSVALPTLGLPFFGHSFEGVLAIRLLQAVGCGTILATVSPVAALWFPLKDRGIVTGIQGTAVSLGIATGFVAAPTLHAWVGNWQEAISWIGVGCLVPVAVTLFVAIAPKPAVPASSGDAYELSHTGSNDFKIAFKQRTTWIGVFVVFCFMWVLNAFNDLTPAYLAIEPPLGVGFGPMVAGKMMMVLEIAAMIGAIATGFVMERIFKGRVRPVIALGYLMFAILTFSIMLPAVHVSTRTITICLVVAGFFRAWVMPNAMAFVAMHYPPHITGKIVGMWIGIGIFGSAAGVIIGSYALRATGNYHLSIIIVSVMSLIGFIATLFLKPPTVFGISAEIDTVPEAFHLPDDVVQNVALETLNNEKIS
ncbi:MAG: MFS transporter [Desulfuromonadaceae bacterium]|nr:MFS transporter [Desulfuromonadaceae bacterium]